MIRVANVPKISMHKFNRGLGVRENVFFFLGGRVVWVWFEGFCGVLGGWWVWVGLNYVNLVSSQACENNISKELYFMKLCANRFLNCGGIVIYSSSCNFVVTNL